MTIDLQIAIIEKIKKIKQNQKKNVLTYHAMLFCCNFVEISLKEAASDMSNFFAGCDRIISAALPSNASELFPLPLFCLWYLGFFAKDFKSLQLSKPAQIILPPCAALMLLAANFRRAFTTASKLALSKQLMNINIVFVIGASPLLNFESSIRDKIKNTIISD